MIVYDTQKNLERREGLPFVNQALSWAILTATFPLLFISSKYYTDLLMSLMITLAAPYILLSINYEVLFYCFFMVTLLMWLVMESARSDSKSSPGEGHHPIGLADVRSALFYMFFCYVAAAGTGNIASVSSFEISSTYRFLTVFDPFVIFSVRFSFPVASSSANPKIPVSEDMNSWCLFRIGQRPRNKEDDELPSQI